METANQHHQLRYEDLARLPRRWFPLWHLDWYILREFLVKYSILLLVFIILFLLGDIYSDISDFLEAGASWRDAIAYFAAKLPGNIRFVLPISMLLGCMWTMAIFGKNMEVTAMRASGVSLFRCGLPILAAGAVVTFVNICLNEFIVPQCEQTAGAIYDRATQKRRNTQHMLAYRSSDLQRHWLFETFSGAETENNVTIKTFWNEAAIEQLIGLPGTPGFEERVREVFGAKADRILSARSVRKEVFDELRGRKMDFYAARVRHNPDTGDWSFYDGTFVSYDRDDERVEAVRGTSTMHPDLKYRQLNFSAGDIPESPQDIMNAIKEKDDLSTVVIWDILHSNPGMPEKIRAIYRTVFFYRIAFPWSCFLAVFLGIPLATKNERTGSMLAIISAVLVIVVYIVIAQVFLVLGKGGVINPVFAGLAPTLAFIAYGVWRIIFDRN